MLEVIKKIVNDINISFPLALLLVILVSVFFLIHKFDKFKGFLKNFKEIKKVVIEHKKATCFIAVVLVIVLLVLCQVLFISDKIRVVNIEGKTEYALGVDLKNKTEVDGYTYFVYESKEADIVYPALYRWKPGINKAERISERACKHFEVVDDTIIYLDSTLMDLSHGALYAMRPDGLNERLLDEEIWDFQIDGDLIYYVYCFDTVGVGVEGHAVHCMESNGKNEMIVAYEISSPQLTSYSSHFNFKIDGDHVVYDDYYIEMSKPADGTERVVYTGDSNYEWIYYTTNRLMKARPDGSEKSELDSECDYWYQVDEVKDGWIYYTKDNDCYKITIRGEEKQLLQ